MIIITPILIIIGILIYISISEKNEKQITEINILRRDTMYQEQKIKQMEVKLKKYRKYLWKFLSMTKKTS